MTQDDLSSRNRQNLDRATASRLDRQHQQEQRDQLTPLPAQAAGFNSRGEMETQRPGHGAIPVRSVNTNGAIGVGQTVRQRGDRVDAMPRVRTSEPAVSSARMVEVAYLFQPEFFYYVDPPPGQPYLNERQQNMFAVVINGQAQDNSRSTYPDRRGVAGTDPLRSGLAGLEWQALSLPIEIEFQHTDCLAGFDSETQPDSLPPVYMTRVFIRSQSQIELNGTALIEPDYQIARPAFIDFNLLAVNQRYTGEALGDAEFGGSLAVGLGMGWQDFLDDPDSAPLTLEGFEEPGNDNPYQNNVIIVDCHRAFGPAFTGVGKVRFE